MATIRTLQQFGRADRSLSLILAADRGATVLAIIIGAIVVVSARPDPPPAARPGPGPEQREVPVDPGLHRGDRSARRDPGEQQRGDCDLTAMQGTTADASGYVRVQFTVSKGPFGANNITCGQAQACLISVTQAAPSPTQEADAPISFG